MENLKIRTEENEDHQNVESVHNLAFKANGEAELVRLLRRGDAFVPDLSIVAELDGVIVGHVLFSKIILAEEDKDLNSLSLAPVAVLPEFQKHGVGRKLIAEGIERAKSLGFSSILVLGDPNYYGRFGFRHELTARIESPYACKAFAGLELSPGVLSNLSKGTAVYPTAFAAVD